MPPIIIISENFREFQRISENFREFQSSLWAVLIYVTQIHLLALLYNLKYSDRYDMHETRHNIFFIYFCRACSTW